MIRPVLALVLATLLTGCAGGTAPVRSAGAVLEQARPTIDQLQARYDAARPFAELMLPYLPAERAAQVRLAAAIVERALAAARLAVTIAEQRAALQRAEQATVTVEAVGLPDVTTPLTTR